MVLFPAPAGPSMATMILLPGSGEVMRLFFRAHPRFFVLRLEEAVKPYRGCCPPWWRL